MAAQCLICEGPGQFPYSVSNLDLAGYGITIGNGSVCILYKDDSLAPAAALIRKQNCLCVSHTLVWNGTFQFWRDQATSSFMFHLTSTLITCILLRTPPLSGHQHRFHDSFLRGYSCSTTHARARGWIETGNTASRTRETAPRARAPLAPLIFFVVLPSCFVIVPASRRLRIKGVPDPGILALWGFTRKL